MSSDHEPASLRRLVLLGHLRDRLDEVDNPARRELLERVLARVEACEVETVGEVLERFERESRPGLLSRILSLLGRVESNGQDLKTLREELNLAWARLHRDTLAVPAMQKGTG